MTPSPQDFYEHAVAAADAEGRLPLPEQAMWEIFPFEPDSLRVKTLDPLTLPEPPRNGESGLDCWRCTNPDQDVVWANERWLLTSRLGDGGAHLHVFLFGRPAGMLQLRGSGLTLWEEMLPVLPAEDRAAVLAVAVDALADLGESRL